MSVGNAAAVIDDRDRIVHMDRYFDRVAITRKRLVDRVVNDLVNQMMQSDLAGRADIHRRPLSDRVAALKHRDRICTVFCLFCFSQF